MISTRSPATANQTLCSPTTSAARIVEKPISRSERGPIVPAASKNAVLIQIAVQRAAASLILSAVPEGASTMPMMRLNDFYIR